VNGIMRALMASQRAIINQTATKSLHKSGMPMNELGQWVNDRVLVQYPRSKVSCQRTSNGDDNKVRGY